MTRAGSHRSRNADWETEKVVRAIDDHRALETRLTEQELESWLVSNLIKRPNPGHTREEAVKHLMQTLASFMAARGLELAISGGLTEEKLLDTVLKAVSKHLEPNQKLELGGKFKIEHELPERLAAAIARKRAKREDE